MKIDKTNTIIIACSSLEQYVSAAQESQGTFIPVIHLDKQLHVEPDRMKAAMADAIAGLPPQVETVLIATGFCGGVSSFSRTSLSMQSSDAASDVICKFKSRTLKPVLQKYTMMSMAAT